MNAHSNHSVFHVGDSSMFLDQPQKRKHRTGSRNHIRQPEESREDIVLKDADEIHDDSNEDAGSLKDQNLE